MELNHHSLNDVDSVSSSTNSKNEVQTKKAAGKAKRRSKTSKNATEALEAIQVTFIPSGEGQLKEIPGFGQVLETRSAEDGKVVRYPIAIGEKTVLVVSCRRGSKEKLCLKIAHGKAKIA